jgi:hypothetical protein
MVANLTQTGSAITGTLTMYGVQANTNYLDFTITKGTIDSQGNVWFQATDEPYHVNLLTFWGPITTSGSPAAMKLDGQYTHDGGPFARNAGYFTLKK